MSYIKEVGISLLICFLLNKALQAMLFIITFSFLRIYCGGYHCKTAITCEITFVLMTTLSIILSDIFNVSFSLFLFALSVATLLIVCPVENENNPISPDKIAFYRTQIMKRILFILSIQLLFITYAASSFINVITFSTTWLCILCAYQDVINKRRRKE